MIAETETASMADRFRMLQKLLKRKAPGSSETEALVASAACARSNDYARACEILQEELDRR